MFIENRERKVKAEAIENGKFRITSTMVDEMDAEMYLQQIQNIQGALDQENAHQKTLPEKLKNDLLTIETNIKNQTMFLEEFKKNEAAAQALVPAKETPKTETVTA